jgi:acyl carrier protein
VEQVITEYISTELVNDPEILPLRGDTPLMESNILDSIAFLNLVVFLEEHFGIGIADTELMRENFETIDVICAFVRRKQNLLAAS